MPGPKDVQNDASFQTKMKKLAAMSSKYKEEYDRNGVPYPNNIFTAMQFSGRYASKK